MKNPVELSSIELMQIEGGSAKPGPTTLVVEVAHALLDYGKGFIDEFLRFSTKK